MANYFLINSLSGGGAERQVSTLINHLNAEKIICLFKKQIYPVDKMKTTFLWPQFYNSGILRFLLIPIFLIRIKKQISPGKHTHIVSFLQLSNITGLCCKLLWKCKLTVSIRTTTSVYYKVYKIGFLTKLLDKLILKHADCLVTNSHGSKEDLIMNFNVPADNIKVIANGYNLNEIELKKNEPFSNAELTALFEKNRVLLTVGRIDIEKGLYHTLYIFSELKKEFKDIKYVILGQGPLKNELKNFATTLNLKVFDAEFDEGVTIAESDLLFLGFQKNPYQFYRNCYLFLFPSLFEGMPNALAEAFLCGATCVAADCKSGPREILTSIDLNEKVSYPYHEFGFLMPAFETGLFNRGKEIKGINIWQTLLHGLLSGKENNELETVNTKSKKEQFNYTKVIEQWNDVLK